MNETLTNTIVWLKGRSTTLILGVGNPLQGDDGVGVRVAEMLADQELPPGVKVEEVGTPGLGLAAWLEGQSRVVIVDAVYMGQSPGTWRRFGPAEVRLIADSDVISLHEPGLAEALALAQALDALPQEIVFYGVEPVCCDAGQELSPAVRQALPGLVDAILAEIWKRKE